MSLEASQSCNKPDIVTEGVKVGFDILRLFTWSGPDADEKYLELQTPRIAKSTTKRLPGVVSKHALYKRKQRQLCSKLASINWRIGPGGKLVIEGPRSELRVTGKSSLLLNGRGRNIPSQIAEASANVALRGTIETFNEEVSRSDIVKWGGAFGTQSIAAGGRVSRGVRTTLGELDPNAHGVEVDGQARGSMIREAIER